MSINFATLQGLSIPEGVVTRIEDAAGNVLWALPVGSDDVILEVEKITGDTYANETTYTGEEFILLDIYPKSGGTVRVTYGGLTKTIVDDGTSETPGAQQVYFGTFNGVSDSLVTPASGTLTISGDYTAFACGAYKKKATSTGYAGCITAIRNFGMVDLIPASAFRGCAKLVRVEIPAGVVSISDRAFQSCSNLSSITIPDGVTGIGYMSFNGCSSLSAVTIPDSVTSIGNYAFRNTGSTYVRTVTMLGETPPTLGGSGVFDDAGSNHIVVPTGCGDAYQTAKYWSEYKNYITEAALS